MNLLIQIYLIISNILFYYISLKRKGKLQRSGIYEDKLVTC